MWNEKRLISFAGPPGNLEGDGIEIPRVDSQPEGPVLPEDKKLSSGHEDLKDSVRNSLDEHGEKVADANTESPEREVKSPFESVADFNKRFAEVRAQFEGLEKMSLHDRKEAILTIRRRIMELKFLLYYVSENEAVEVVDGHSVYTENENAKLDLTASSRELRDIVNKLYEIKAEDNKVAVRLYENLEQTRDTIRPRDFLKLPLVERLKLVSNIKSWDELTNETLVVFNFGKNSALQYQIGLGDLMPPEIRKFSLGGSVYARRATQGFYNGGRYLAIFNGTRVKVEEVDKAYLAKSETEYANKFGAAYSVADKLEGRELARSEVLEVAKSFGVDAHFLEALLSQVKADDENGITEDYEFLHIAARYVQNAEAKFGASALDGNHYSLKFVAYALDHFNLFADYGGRSMHVDAVSKKYAAMRGFEFKPEEREVVEKSREVDRPRTMKEVEQIGGRSKYQGEIAYEAVDLSHGSEEMKQRMERRLEAFEAALESSSVPEQYRSSVLAKARAAYETMIGRMGTAYKGMVGIRRPGGKLWTINNNCVGHAMKVMENTGIRLVRGRQAGKQAANFYWGTYNDGSRDFKGRRAWLRSMIPDESYLVDVHVTPENCDRLIGQHLAVGECAPGGLWNHAFWIYKDFNGVVMICHSGADVRPKRIAAQGEIPPGYKRVGAYYVKQSGSKVNEVPLSYFLARTQKNYAPPRNSLTFVPLTKLFMGNMESQPMA